MGILQSDFGCLNIERNKIQKDLESVQKEPDVPEAGLSFLRQGAVYLKQPGTQPVRLGDLKIIQSGLGDLPGFQGF